MRWGEVGPDLVDERVNGFILSHPREASGGVKKEGGSGTDRLSEVCEDTIREAKGSPRKKLGKDAPTVCPAMGRG